MAEIRSTHSSASSRPLVLRLLVWTSFWSALQVTMAKTAADYFVRSLPGLPAGDQTKMHAG